MLKQKLHQFYNSSSPDYGPNSGRKYSGNIKLSTTHKSIPPEYENSNGSSRKYLDIKCLLCLMKYIYIYIYPQTGCFVLLELFSVATHAGRSKPGSKPDQLYVRLSFRPLGHQADHLANGILKYLYIHIYIYFKIRWLGSL